jgi:hypothetical protein
MTTNDEAHYDRLNAVERVKLALAKRVAGQSFDVRAEDVQALVEAYDRLRDRGKPT